MLAPNTKQMTSHQTCDIDESQYVTSYAKTSWLRRN